MPLKPEGSSISVGGYTLFVADVKYTFVTEYFDRVEFQHERLRNAPNLSGQHAIRTTLLGNTPAQIVIGSLSFQDVVPLNPDVTVTSSNYGNIKKKFNIKRYEITGMASAVSQVDAVYSLAQNHLQQLAKFQAYLDKAGSMETEYLELKALQSETFSYLTTTGTSLSGDAIESTQTNMLITRFEPSVDYAVVTDSVGTVFVLKSYSLTIENRVITAKDSVI